MKNIKMKIQCLFKGHDKVSGNSPTLFVGDEDWVKCKRCGKLLTKVYLVGSKN